MATLSPIDLAHRYFVNDLPGSTIPASRLRKIIEKNQGGLPLTTNELTFLRQQGLAALEQLARGEITHETFQKVASLEQAKREQLAEAERLAQEAASANEKAERMAREADYWARQEAARIARESDPVYIARMKNRALRSKYGIDIFVEQEHLHHLMNILHRFDGGKRLTDDDVLWLKTEGHEYNSDALQAAFHEREADFYADEYRRTTDPWNAVSASGHYRKCKQSGKAHDLLSSLPNQSQAAPKLRSAIATTHGGVMRDLHRLDDAMNFGNQAHELTPKDFRPCTLLGAVNFELGNYDIGQDWYDKAIERGAQEHSIDQDLRGILLRADSTKRKEIKEFLLRKDPDRYGWVKDFPRPNDP